MKIRAAALFLFLFSFVTAARAEDRLGDISKLILGGRVAEARMKLQAAVEEYRTEKDLRGEALSLMLLGFSDVEIGDIDAAHANLQSAAEKLAATGDFFTGWMAMLFVAGVDMRSGNWELAVRQHEIALAMLRDAGASDAPFSLDAFKSLGPLFGMQTDLFTLLPLPSETMKRVLLLMAEMVSRDALGTALIELGKYERAETELMRASELSAMFMGAADAPIAAHLGELHRRQWHFDEARKHYRKAIESVGWMPLPDFLHEPMELRILGQLAEIELLSGRLNEALDWNDRALQFVREKGQVRREASLLQDRATLLMQANRFADSLKVLEHALPIAQSSDLCLTASIFTDIGSLYMYRGDYGTAVAEIEKAIDLYQIVHAPVMEGHAWTMLAEVYLGMGAYDSAGYATDHVRALAKKGGFRPAEDLVEMLDAQRRMMSGQGTVAEVVRNLQKLAMNPEARHVMFTPRVVKLFADLLDAGANPSAANPANLDPDMQGTSAMPIAAEIGSLLRGRELFLRGDPAGAREAWTQALEQSSSADIRSGYLAAIGATYSQEGKQEEANRWFRQAADLVDASVGGIADSDLLARYLGSERRWYFDLVIDMLAQSGNAREAFDYAERARARAFLQIIGNHRVHSRGTGTDRLVREAESLRIRIAEWERNGAPVATDPEHARTRYRALMRRVNTTNPEYASLMRIDPLKPDAVRAGLPADTALISYFLTRSAAHAWILDRDSFEYVRLPLGKDSLQRAVCWSERFRPPDGRGGEALRAECDAATAEEVFDLLIAPLRKHLRKPRLFIVPHGGLHQIPFGALRDRKSGRYLIQDYTLLFAPSASALQFLREKETPVDGGALVLGDPDGSLGRLQGAEREARAIARDLGTTAFIGPDAKESLLYDLEAVDLVHIGAHGRYDSTNPLFSRIALAPDDSRDGNLNVTEILSGVDLRGVNLVVLSACRTAAGERSGGDDIIGLTRALLYAGTPGVISTLWNIDDDASAVLMEDLYCRLLNGEMAADALREAQLSLLRLPQWRDPQYWGAFMLTGDPQGRFQRSR